MGVCYNSRKMNGFYIYGPVKGIFEFLAENGYSFTEDERNEIDENGWEEILPKKGCKFEVDCVDPWSGYDWTVGLDTSKRNSMKIMQDAFPNLKPERLEFVQLS